MEIGLLITKYLQFGQQVISKVVVVIGIPPSAGEQ